ncbi:hypothetical protein V8G54_008486 [Vigna mungo]|uniref:Uncharacterized protein n=1 Tax=Vigna mungo TaxID=3915 RepID=A0AAQ3P3L1_VIGMU
MGDVKQRFCTSLRHCSPQLHILRHGGAALPHVVLYYHEHEIGVFLGFFVELQETQVVKGLLPIWDCRKLVEELVKELLRYVVEAVHDFLLADVTKDHFLRLIDWVEGQRPILEI